jgi:hypothetical protein
MVIFDPIYCMRAFVEKRHTVWIHMVVATVGLRRNANTIIDSRWLRVIGMWNGRGRVYLVGTAISASLYMMLATRRWGRHALERRGVHTTYRAGHTTTCQAVNIHYLSTVKVTHPHDVVHDASHHVIPHPVHDLASIDLSTLQLTSPSTLIGSNVVIAQVLSCIGLQPASLSR